MTTKFFTNKDGNTLLEKFKGAFEYNPHIREFDVLVAYFYSSGYFKVQPFLKNVPKVRILVGIDLDIMTVKYRNQGLKFSGASPEEIAQDYLKALRQEIDDADYSEETEESIRQFIKGCCQGKIQIRAHPSRKLHAKIYILRPENFNSHNMGEVITGSSNLSEAGLGVAHNAKNYEFNVSLRDYEDVKFATEEFETLWREGEEISSDAIQETQNKTFLKDEFTPFELYIKMLIEYFGSEIEFNPDNIKDLPGNFKRLTYQLDAMNQGYEILKKHNGLFLADVVGLGKTIVAILIARRYFLFHRPPERIPRMLIIIPPALKSQWKETVEQFRMRDQVHVKIMTNGSLHKVENPEDYDLIIVDEAHKFRNDSTIGYENLQKICKTPCQSGEKNKKVILMSATPLNNRPDDIYNQVLLFQDANNSTLGIPLGDFFSRINRRYNEIISKNARYSTSEKTAELYTEVRNKVIEPLTVRRTRTDLMNHELYKKDLEKQGFTLPKLSEPQKLLYPLEGSLNELYNKTVKLITNDMQYIRYRAIEFIKTEEHARNYKRPEFISAQLVGIMKTLLIKRLDSSFYAFHCTLKRFVRASEAMLKMIDNDRICIAPDHKVEEYIMEDKEDELLQKLAEDQDTDPRIKILKKSDFKDDFTEELKKDHYILTNLEKEWGKIIQIGIDPKLQKFFSVLNKKLLLKSYNPEQKLVIFSESQETTEYLKDKLISAGRRDVLAVSSINRGELQKKIRYNFDADVSIGQQRSEYNIIVTTEVLAEGVNLHRSNVILNYDTPWNATRLMQRIGRINRISTKADEIYVYNFFPTENVENDIQLKKRAIIKLQAFHSALGEDSQIYSTDEQVESFGLFDKNPQADNESSERLKYLMEIRKFKEESPDEFRRIKNLPPKIRNAVKNPERRGGTLSYLRDKQHHAFYQVNQNEELKELSFLEAAPILKCDPSTKTLPLHKEHHKQVKQALEHFSKAGETKIVLEQQKPNLRPHQNRAINYVKAKQNYQHIREEEKQKLGSAIEIIKRGKFQALPRDINNLQNSTKNQNLKTTDLLERLLKIIDKYPLGLELELDSEESIKKPAENMPRVIIAQSYI